MKNNNNNNNDLHEDYVNAATARTFNKLEEIIQLGMSNPCNQRHSRNIYLLAR